MKIRARDVTAAAKELYFEEPTTELSRLLAAPVDDFRLPPLLAVNVSYYRAGTDLFFQGHVDGPIVGRCSRCLEDYVFALALDFSFIFAPRHEKGRKHDLDGDGDLTYYDGEEVDLSPLLRERVLLALPTRPLCSESCAGLCPRCGSSRSQGMCGCQVEGNQPLDPRLAMLRSLKVNPSS